MMKAPILARASFKMICDSPCRLHALSQNLTYIFFNDIKMRIQRLERGIKIISRILFIMYPIARTGQRLKGKMLVLASQPHKELPICAPPRFDIEVQIITYLITIKNGRTQRHVAVMHKQISKFITSTIISGLCIAGMLLSTVQHTTRIHHNDRRISQYAGRISLERTHQPRKVPRQ